MRIVLDTNVLWVVSGVLQLCLDWRILYEYRTVLQRPTFRFDPQKVNDFLTQIEKNGIPVEPFPALSNLPDKSDAMFLEVALVSMAEFLVTGNLKHFSIRERRGIQVISPMKFIEAIKKSSAGL
jgi:predicted nucleic acid-binding protein